VTAEGFDPLTATDDDAGLRAAKQLVARKTDQIGAIGEQLADRGLGRQTPTTQIVQTAGTLINEKGQLMTVSRIGQIGGRGLGSEADDAEVRLVGHEDCRGVIADGCLEVREMGAVRAADLDEVAARGSHDVGKSERPADLDELAARDDDLAADGVGTQNQKQGGGIVVDHHGRLGATDGGDALTKWCEALSPPTGGQVKLQCEV